MLDQFQAIFNACNLGKLSAKLTRKTTKKFKSLNEKLDHHSRQLAHCITMLHLVNIVATQDRISEVTTVLWVDDSPHNNIKEREKAKKASGIEFALATSTDEALAWLAENEEQLKDADSSRFRIVTDWYRPDEKDDAASSLMQQVRDAGWKVPILVYCSESTNPYPLVSIHENTAAATSDHLLTMYWATMKLTAQSLEATGKGKQRAPVKAQVEEHEENSDEEEEAPKPKAKGVPKTSAAKAAGTTKADADKPVAKATAKTASSTKAEDEEPIAKATAKATAKASAKSSSSVSSKASSGSLGGKKASSLANTEDEEESAPEPPKVEAPKKTTSATGAAAPKAKKANAILFDDLDDDEEEVKPKPAATTGKPKKAAALAVEESDEEAHVATPPSTPPMVKAPSLTPDVTPVKSFAAAMDTDEKVEEIDATLPSEMEGIEEAGTPVNISIDISLGAKKTKIHDLLASRIPKDEDEEDEDDTPLPPIPKSRKSSAAAIVPEAIDDVPELPAKTHSGGAKAKKATTKKVVNQLFGDDEDVSFSDVDKMDEDESIEEEDDWNDAVASAKKKKPAKKTSAASKSASLEDEEDPPSATKTPEMSRANTAAQSKRDWNSFLMSRIPSSMPPGSPLSVADDSTDEPSHLLLTPPPSVKKTAKKTAKTSSDVSKSVVITETTTTRKSATVVGVKSPPKSPEPVGTPMVGMTPTASPTEKPAPPKPTAPMGPTPMRSLSALDDLEDSNEDELPIFNKLPQPPVLTGSSSNLKNEPADPKKSTVVGILDEWIVGQVSSVTIETRTKNGALTFVNDLNVTLEFRHPQTQHVFDAYVIDNKNGTYTAQFFPTQVNKYVVKACINKKLIPLDSAAYFNIVAPPTLKKRVSASMFSVDDDDDEEEALVMAPPTAKKFKYAEPSLPDPEELDGDGEGFAATQVV